MMSNMDRIIREEARLVLLAALAAQADRTLNSELLRAELDAVGIRRTRAFVDVELSHLADIGAVTLAAYGEVRIATLTQTGLDHVERRALLPGVKRPAPLA